MNSRIVSNGPSRLYRDKDFQDRLRERLQELHATIEAQYTAELAEAGFIRRLLLRWRIATEYRQKRRELVPSRESLFSGSRG